MRPRITLLVIAAVLGGLLAIPTPALAAQVRHTSISGLSLSGKTWSGDVVRDAFRVTGPKRRRVELRYRVPGEQWVQVQQARTSGSRKVKVRVKALRRDGQVVWKVRLQGRRWKVATTTDSDVLDLRMVVSARPQWSDAASRAQTIMLRKGLPPAPGTRVTPARAQQVLVADRVSGVRGTSRRYEWNAARSRWVRVGSAPAVFGYGGVVSGSERRQNTGTTPAGTYRLLYAFGSGDPGTSMPYRKVTECSHWVLDPDAADYNRWRESCQNPPEDGERLMTYVKSGQYRQAVVTSYNYDDPRVRAGKGSGAAIFVHHATTHTGGCVGVTDRAELTEMVRWLDPEQNPLIVIKK